MAILDLAKPYRGLIFGNTEFPEYNPRSEPRFERFKWAAENFLGYIRPGEREMQLYGIYLKSFLEERGLAYEEVGKQIEIDPFYIRAAGLWSCTKTRPCRRH